MGCKAASAVVLSGVFAALPTPVQNDGRPDLDAVTPMLDRLVASGIAGLCVGGATGEYASFDIDDRIRLLRHVGRYVAGRMPWLCGIGAETWLQTQRIADAARQAGAAAALLPPPSYFSYPSEDLREILSQVASQIPLPAILYHIPQFTNALKPADAISIVRSVEHVVGIKDSSGDLNTLAEFSRAREETGFALMVGSDDLMLRGLQLGANGAISGCCSAAPQLVNDIYHAFKSGNGNRARELQSILQSFIDAFADLPAPWGIKIVLDAEGFPMGCSSWPAGPGLQSRIDKLRLWYKEWRAEIQPRLSDGKVSTN
jgi:dihydrodipicolinate synthase/N-acetylneuraminate lyase